MLLLLACTSREAEPPPSTGEPSAGRPPGSAGSSTTSGAAPLPEADLPPTANRATWEEMWADARAPRSPADGGGTLRKLAGPDVVQAGDPIALELELEVGPHGVAVGGAIVLTPSPFWGWTPPQTRSPDAPGATSFTAPAGVTLRAEDLPGMVAATVEGRALEPGERVTVRYAHARADRFAEARSALWVAVDGDGDGIRSVLPHPVTVAVAPGPPAALIVTVPSAVEPGKPAMLRIAAVDRVGNAYLAGWDLDRSSASGPADPAATVPGAGRSPSAPGRGHGSAGGATRFGEVRIEAPGLEAPNTVALDRDGLAAVPVVAREPGVYRIAVHGADGLGGTSNPMVVRAGAPPILWADLQVHSGLSDGTGEPAELYRYAREVAGLDVAAVTDHDHWGMRFLDRAPDLRGQIADATEAAYVPGGFVAIHGFEWTSWAHGHRHVLWFDQAPGAWPSSLDPASDTPAELHAALRGRPALVIRHHPAGGPVAVDWSFPIDPALEPVVEVASVHGQSESASLPGAIYDAVPEAFADRQLAGGARFGLVGSTDGHDGHPGLAQLAGGSGGLAALEGAEPTRESVLATLRARRVYATNGARIVLRVEAGGVPMGGEVTAAGPVPVEARVVGTAPIARIELVRSAGVVGSWTGDGARLAHASWEVDPTPGDLVYVRVVQADGGLAWSSPITFR